jgi:hypothetical protein
VGKVVQPLQSVNCHDSRAHSHERHGPFTRLVGISGWDLWFGLDLVDLVMGAAGVKPGCMFGYRWDACER